ATILEEPQTQNQASPETLRTLRRKVHQTIRSVTRDYEQFEFNTVISSLMELLNVMVDAKEAGAFGTPEWEEAIDIYLRLMAPATPHIAEELWFLLGKPYSIHTQPWPEVDEEAAKEEMFTLVIQINGRVRDRVELPVSASEEEAKRAALESPIVQKHLSGSAPKQVIYVRGRLVNIVVN
ncbi:MAG: class I tRNA ligase family protein, partial [Anaerolineales bacterium]|nr:class I tRNA ligase family protein [Anaerolineales bacterium]MDW8447847.1 class I tRNA ligase family protein [Anaerolineales bacterium]